MTSRGSAIDPELGKPLIIEEPVNNSLEDKNMTDRNLHNNNSISNDEHDDEDDDNLKTSKSKRRVKRLRKKVKAGSDGSGSSPLIKYGSLVLLVAQLVGLVMLMRYSRTHSNGKDMYLSSTAVFCMEVSQLVS
jgi:hypothetical protein